MTREKAIALIECSANELRETLKETTMPSSASEQLQMYIDAYEMAISALRQEEHFREVNKALTLDELSERNAPVFLPIKDFPNGGYWCLCENGYIVPPSGHGFMAKERQNWVFYSQKPEEDDRDERKENENA